MNYAKILIIAINFNFTTYQILYTSHFLILSLHLLLFFSGDNVEDAFLETAKKIFQSIQDGR